MAYEQANGAMQKGIGTASRIECDIESVKLLTRRVDDIASNIFRHTRSLGYSEPPNATTAAPEPVITTLSDALRALERAVEHATDSVSVFG
jgi:hypothetical protein